MKYIITERQYNFLANANWGLLNEQTVIPQRYGYDPSRASSDYLGRGGTFEREKATIYGDPKVMTLAIGKKSGTPMEDAMETFREGLFTPSGIAISTFLTSFGWGAPVVATSFGGLLAWDIYKSINGDTDWFNIIVDTLSLATSGVLSNLFAPMMGAGKAGLNSAAKALEYLKSSTAWKSIVPYLKTIARGLSNAGGWISEGIKWLAENTGISLLLKVSAKIVSFFAKITNSILEFIGQATSQVVSKATASANTSKAAGTAAKSYTGAKSLEQGASLVVPAPAKGANIYQNKPSSSSLATAQKMTFN